MRNILDLHGVGRRRLLRHATSLILLGCGPAAVPAPTPSTTPVASATIPAGATVRPGLPTVPSIRGAAIVPRVQYPDDNQLVGSRDSNFVLGSVGSGDVQLTINGEPVAVAPNGAFIAFLANPPAPNPQYALVASRGADTVRQVVKVRYPVRTSLPYGGRLRVDSGSVSPARGVWARADDMVRVSVRAPRNATVKLRAGPLAGLPAGRPAGRPAGLPVGSLQRTAERSAGERSARERSAGERSGGERGDSVVRTLVIGTGLGVMRAGETTVGADTTDASAVFATDIAAHVLGDSAQPARLIIVRGVDTVRLAVPFVRALSADSRLLAMTRVGAPIGADTDQTVNARTIPEGTYKWLLLPGTILPIAGRQAGYTRLALDNTLDAWVANGDLTLLPDGAALPRRVTGGLRVNPAKEWVDLVIPTGDRPAHLVESDGRTLVLTLYGVQANPEISPIIGNDTLIRRIAWEQVTSERVRIALTLSQPVYGWLSLWDDARKAFVLRVRRIPTINADRPLAGLTIAVDPGHPPAGATGPTGLYEGDAVFPVGMKVVELLKARGANAFSTRSSLAPVGLTERGVMSRRANAHAFVSIHLNALPDGVNPFLANGTSTLFFHNASEPLARVLEDELVKRFGLRDLGVHYQNLAVARPSWYPSALTEGLFVMMPEQEAAMRDAGFQAKYAEGIVAGLERYFAALRVGR